MTDERWRELEAEGNREYREHLAARQVAGKGIPPRPVRPAPPKLEPGTYTHVGWRPYVGHYAVTADAYRKSGKSHALNLTDRYYYTALCGVRVRADGVSGDHFLEPDPPVPAAQGRVTCKRCLRAIKG